ncbi:helix-turn-helix domain-containing protein [Deinococcus sp. YIM 77859]|uniref:helix-turn-helix domain-containing protein n=1 Tax=Deinococcus sp. YIM 77859 TaxID=1540221 RepID=UPI000ABF791E|nr:helix-turn-helix transcriptional regulator [Deinococcus sp. YIM 77859]
MNEQVRRAVRERMQEQGLTQTELGELVGMAQPNVQRLLAGRVGAVPESWQRVLDALGLELVAVPRKEA